jgi:uroporphyrinogen-III decarboxylase
MKWNREQYIELMTFGKVERQMFVELFGPLVGLEGEWLAQGASREEVEMVAFDWDYVPLVACGENTGLLSERKPVVLEDTPEYIITLDGLGRRMKLFKNVATDPLPLDYPVRSFKDWLVLKPMFEYREERIDTQMLEAARQAQSRGALTVAEIPGGFDMPRQLMGVENLCIAYYEDPELVHDILDTIGNTSTNVLERLSEQITVDLLSVHEDLAGKSGPVVGPLQIEQFIKPYYLRNWEILESRGTRLFCQDSDGDIRPVIDSFLEAGVNIMHPMEPTAGMDVVEIRKKYGSRLAMQGGIDKHVLRRSKEDIRKELEYKMQPLMQRGGMVFGLDHRIPNGTPLDNYRYYVDLGRELLGLPPRTAERKGWARMGSVTDSFALQL